MQLCSSFELLVDIQLKNTGCDDLVSPSTPLHRAEHPLPADLLIPCRVALEGDEIIHKIYDQKAGHDRKLIDRDHSTPDSRRANLGYVHW